MPFQDVPSDVDFVTQEHEVLRFWQETNAFEQLRQLRKGQPQWSFVDGPITANNPMGVHHGWGRTYKDIFNRFWAMQGRELRYQNGFDCQGLWVEVEVEKTLGFKSKKDIEAYGLEPFVRRCKARVLQYAAVQTAQSIRLGYWMDWNDTEQLHDLGQRLMANPSEVITVSGPPGAGDRYRRTDCWTAGFTGARGQLLYVLEREQLHDLDVSQEMLGERLALSRGRCHALVPALCHRYQPARDRDRRLPRDRPPQCHPTPAPARSSRRIVAGLDDHTLDADQ